MPFVITHWINLVAMILLIITGFSIHFPFWGGFMGIARGVHVFMGFVLFINCIVRVIMAFFVKSAPDGGTRYQVTDFKTWLPQADNRHQLGAWIPLLPVLQEGSPAGRQARRAAEDQLPGHPHPHHRDVLHGPVPVEPDDELAFFAGGTDLVGGLMSMRIIHYFMMYVFICFMSSMCTWRTSRASPRRSSCSSGKSTAVWSTTPRSTPSWARTTSITTRKHKLLAG